MDLDNARRSGPGPRHSVELDRAEALALLARVSFGRVVFTQHALPTVRPVSHVLDGEDIVFRTHEGSALTSRTRTGTAQGVVVAYEADVIDPDTHLGWSVVITGFAQLVDDPEELTHYRALLRPWVKQGLDYAVRIRPDLVTGIRLTEAVPAVDDRAS
ncbi:MULTISPECIES: pyridoxamine 5'-phosphate oxidase family protein [unclassified Streptomyces]|uniref:pyridoxamine 5'-phosphate oxidase family protein n=1 Tax=unclassified Streptomyces TaxID=2593676 RepID=UPI00278BEFDB|nr:MULTISPECIES: pyridoxamine 5'-phosphate oxidase family protein [unclassified Streptomyces]